MSWGWTTLVGSKCQPNPNDVINPKDIIIYIMDHKIIRSNNNTYFNYILCINSYLSNYYIILFIDFHVDEHHYLCLKKYVLGVRTIKNKTTIKYSGG